MTTETIGETIALKQFGERLMRIFARNQAGEHCICGLSEGHLPRCPQHVWEVAQLLTQMELDDSLRR